MMYTAVFVYVLAILFSSVRGDCSASVTVQIRAGASYVGGGSTYDIYDFEVSNTGTDPITALSEDIIFAVGASHPSVVPLTQAWNFDQATGNITGFVILYPGQSYTGAGFVINSVADISPIAPTTICGLSSSTPTIAPSGAPTNPPTSSPTVAPTSAPTNPPIQSAGSCSASLTLSLRETYPENGEILAVYDMYFTNNGTLTVIRIFENIIFAYGSSNPSTASASQTWNFNETTGEITSFGALNPGQVFTGAGFIIDGAADISPISTTAYCA